MRTDIKISIVVPIYNIREYLERCIKSLLKQTYSNIEIIAVDDGSTDGSGEILDEYAQRDVRVIPIHKENGGVTSARLVGVSASTGEYIGFVDGDDFIEPEMYEVLLENALKYNADISHCGYQMVFPSRVDFYHNTGRLVKQDKQEGLKDLLDGSFIEPGLWNKLFHKTLFHNLVHEEKMDMSIKNTEDLLMNYYLFSEASRSVYLDRCYYHYMVRGTSAANMPLNQNQLLDPIKVSRILVNETINNHELNDIATNRLVSQLIMLATMSSKTNAELIVPNRTAARKELRESFMKFLISCHSVRMKMKIVWSTWIPDTYMLVHKIYAHITGIDRKYAID